MKKGITPSSNLKAIIQNSHKRCITIGIDKNIKKPIRILSGKKLDRILKKNSLFISVAYPFMKLLEEFLDGTGFLIDLTDCHGNIISIMGNESIIAHANNMGMGLGTDMSEQSCGTNSIGTALHENCSIQMAGKEHFINIFHIWTCSCSPIHDTQGNIIGCLNVTGFYNSVHPHTLGFVFSTAELIENKLKNIAANKHLWHISQLNETIFNAVDMGLLLISKDGNIKTVNKRACEMFLCTKEDLLKDHAIRIFSNWNAIMNTLEKKATYSDDELINYQNNKKKKMNINVFPIYDVDNKFISAVVALKDMKNIYKLVNKYSGKNAYYTFHNIIGKSVQMDEIIQYAKTVANTPSTIIIQGESGTGKEVLAQAIHNESEKRNEPFIAINCGAIPRNLIASELFGYEKGAFTNARSGGMPGKFELAHNGTLFLDEIGEMPIDMQVNLLRVLQEKRITRIGGTKSISIDVRVIAATNKNLLEEVKKGNFREDLYYRLNVIPIHIPPLRDRKEDIRTLVNYFLEKKSEKLERKIVRLSKDEYKILMDYDWPGNVRELENGIENYIINGKLYMDLHREGLPQNQVIESSKQIKYTMQSLSEWEKIAIEECLAHCNRNITKTAAILKIDRSTLYKKIRLYDI
ncbi:MAG: sigma 54-interacting transcriptional regulator [Anaeromicrobium sp.]|uniref:sigma-54-dependent Fis family transcriptional regulator n=1 Tax=Anaeromicrobium sp. TaxID=1929132 RepID=UPI0025ECF314|nr:sigma 54-interacting transcriptional regulator [Anaeromicrobium sp.]MCT4593471.1 sigma 54-interacting transcriptional regulator [Anaeromicrobium sp.]